MKSVNYNFSNIVIILTGFIFISILSTNLITSNRVKSKSETKIDISSRCGPLCLECVEADTNSCTVCKNGIFQYNNLCFTVCPIGTYSDQEWQVCRTCDSECPICWGPRADMCGSTPGVETTVVLLENEIKKYFSKKPLNKDDIVVWINKLNIILQNINKLSLTNLIESGNGEIEFIEITNDEMLSPVDVYNSKKIEIELPLGSFSRNDGVFIPVPSYLNKKFELVNSHWLFIKGMWDGHTWNCDWFPKIPSFIKYHGEKNKIYFENNGYWIFDTQKDWYWMKSLILKGNGTPTTELLSDLNTVKFEFGDLNTKMLQQKVSMKKLQIEDHMIKFFDKFAENNRLIFSKLIDTVNNEENNLLGSLEDLSRRTKLYLGEEILLSKKLGEIDNVPETDANFRRVEKIKKIK